MRGRTLYLITTLVVCCLTHAVKSDICEPTWFLYEHKCFKLFEETIAHSAVKEHCTSKGARLLSALTPKLKDFLLLHTGEHDSASYWCSTQTGEIDSELVPHTSAPSPHPMNATVENVSSTGKKAVSCYYLEQEELHDGGCEVSRGFICEKDSVLRPMKCPEDTEKVGASCFWRTSGLLNKTKAQESCSKEGGRLANLDTKRKRAYAIATVPLKKKDLWVGATKQGGKIKWDNGQILDSEQEKPLVPIKDERGDCVILGLSNASKSGTSWIFGDCGRTAYALCEKDAVLTPIPMNTTTSIPQTTWKPSCPGAISADREIDGVCYWETSYETPRLGWDNARKYCQSYGGDLASYKNAQEEEMALGSAKGQESGFWIGLKREPNSNIFRWSDGSTLTYTNWAEGEPKLKGNLKLCVAQIGKNSTWAVTYCGVIRWFVCKIPKAMVPSSPVIPTVPTSTQCERDKSSPALIWIQHGDYCYALESKEFTWNTGKTFCQDNGAFLASLHSLDEINFLLSLLPYGTPVKDFWLGLRAKGLHSSYRWDDGTPFDFVSWDEDDTYDDAANTDTCVVIELSTGSWKKNHCNSLEHVVCKARIDTHHTFSTPVPTPSLPGYCPDGWYTHGNKCYRLFGLKNRSTWSEANKQCVQIGSQLVSIHSKEEQDFLEILLLTVESDTWIGLYSTIGGRLFHWTDNSTIDYTNWDNSEPSFANGEEECAHLAHNKAGNRLGRWNDHKCSMRFPFICQIPKDPMLSKPGQDEFRCLEPEGWIKLGSSCYQIFNISDQRLTWLQAQSFCLSLKANLVSVQNLAVSTVLKLHLPQSTGLFWIGMKEVTSNRYQWVSTGSTVAYTNWLPGEPSRTFRYHNCVAMNAEGQWMVKNCDESHPFICEKTTASPTTLPYYSNLVCPNTTNKWQDFGGQFCYIIEMHNTKPWYEASAICIRQGGHLASFHSEDENDVIWGQIRSSDEPVHIGFSQMEDGNYGWFDGSGVDYVNWAPGEPNDPYEMCTEMHSHVGTWNDINCDSMRGYVCSAKKVPRVVSTANSLEQRGEGLKRRLTAGGIVGIVICIVVVFVVLGFAFYYLCPSTRMRARRQSEISQL